MDSEKYLTALDKVVKKRFPCNSYHIGGYQEAAVCIQSDDVGWVIYNGERGNQYDKIECDTILKACLEFIRKLTHNVQEIASMEEELLFIITDVA